MLNNYKLMNIKLFKIALGIVLTATTISASAQKTYTEGMITISGSMNGQKGESKYYFRADSSAVVFNQGPATLKMLQDVKYTSFAFLVDVPAFSVKKAGIASPSEVEDIMNALPKFTFTTTTETKQISGFNCKKVVATDSKTNKTYDIWITNDVIVPSTAIPPYYAGIGGFPVQFTSFSMGQAIDATVVSISDQKIPAGTFGISPDYDRITLEELRALNPRH